MADELMDVVDSQDRVVGQKYKHEIYALGLKTFRVVNAFIENSRKEVLFPRRSMDRRIFPGGMDMSVGGHVRAGESYLEALFRETGEECAIDLAGPGVSYELIAKLSPFESPVSAFMHFYVIRTDLEPVMAVDEFAGFEWTHPQAMLDRLKPGAEIYKDDLPVLLRAFLKL